MGSPNSNSDKKLQKQFEENNQVLWPTQQRSPAQRPSQV